MDAEPIATVDDRKNKLKKGLQDVPTLSDGRRCIRTLRFERSEGQRKCSSFHRSVSEIYDALHYSLYLGKVYTSVNIYEQNQNYSGILRWGTAAGTSIDGGNIEYVHVHTLMVSNVLFELR